MLILLAGAVASEPYARFLPMGPAAGRDAARADRIARASERVVPASLRGGFLDVGLSSRDELGAWSWPDGRIRVSRSLVDLLDDEELAAAIAHELGHLLAGGELPDVAAALGGTEWSSDDSAPETQADWIGCRLLAARGESPEALVRMLAKVSVVATERRLPFAASFAGRAARAAPGCRSRPA
jgi:Zn-dependent protease with chaperone function